MKKMRSVCVYGIRRQRAARHKPQARTIDYTTYRFCLRDYLLFIPLYCVSSWCLSYILFKSPVVSAACMLIGSPFFLKRLRTYLRGKRIRLLEQQFSQVLQQLAGSLSAGQSLENSLKEFIETDREGKKLIMAELQRVYHMLQLNYPFSYAFACFAQRSGSADIKSFAAVLQAGIPAGIDLIDVMRRISASFRLKYDIEDEIASCLALPRYNNRILMLMPFLCTGLLHLIAPAYIAVLYAGPGRWVMAAVALLLCIAGLIGERLSRIRY